MAKFYVVVAIVFEIEVTGKRCTGIYHHMIEAPPIAMAGFGPGSGSNGHGSYNARLEVQGLTSVLEKTGDVTLAAREGAKNALTAQQEFVWGDAIIPFDWKIVNNRWTINGRTVEEFSDPTEIGGDRTKRVLAAEKEMIGNHDISQAIVVSEDLGYGRSYLYIYNRGENDVIHTQAVEYQGNQSELQRLVDTLGRRTHRPQDKNEKRNDFTSPLFFTQKNALTLENVFDASITSFESATRRQEQYPYLQRLARDVLHYDQLLDRRSTQEQALTKYFERTIVKDDNVRAGIATAVYGAIETADKLFNHEQRRRNEESTIVGFQPMQERIKGREVGRYKHNEGGINEVHQLVKDKAHSEVEKTKTGGSEEIRIDRVIREQHPRQEPVEQVVLAAYDRKKKKEEEKKRKKKKEEPQLPTDEIVVAEAFTSFIEQLDDVDDLPVQQDIHSQPEVHEIENGDKKIVVERIETKTTGVLDQREKQKEKEELQMTTTEEVEAIVSAEATSTVHDAQEYKQISLENSKDTAMVVKRESYVANDDKEVDLTSFIEFLEQSEVYQELVSSEDQWSETITQPRQESLVENVSAFTIGMLLLTDEHIEVETVDNDLHDTVHEKQLEATLPAIATIQLLESITNDTSELLEFSSAELQIALFDENEKQQIDAMTDDTKRLLPKEIPNDTDSETIINSYTTHEESVADLTPFIAFLGQSLVYQEFVSQENQSSETISQPREDSLGDDIAAFTIGMLLLQDTPSEVETPDTNPHDAVDEEQSTILLPAIATIHILESIIADTSERLESSPQAIQQDERRVAGVLLGNEETSTDSEVIITQAIMGLMEKIAEDGEKDNGDKRVEETIETAEYEIHLSEIDWGEKIVLEEEHVIEVYMVGLLVVANEQFDHEVQLSTIQALVALLDNLKEQDYGEEGERIQEVKSVEIEKNVVVADETKVAEEIILLEGFENGKMSTIDEVIEAIVLSMTVELFASSETNEIVEQAADELINQLIAISDTDFTATEDLVEGDFPQRIIDVAEGIMSKEIPDGDEILYVRLKILFAAFQIETVPPTTKTIIIHLLHEEVEQLLSTTQGKRPDLPHDEAVIASIQQKKTDRIVSQLEKQTVKNLLFQHKFSEAPLDTLLLLLLKKLMIHLPQYQTSLTGRYGVLGHHVGYPTVATPRLESLGKKPPRPTIRGGVSLSLNIKPFYSIEYLPSRKKHVNNFSLGIAYSNNDQLPMNAVIFVYRPLVPGSLM